LLLTARVQAQNLFVAGMGSTSSQSSGYITEITPGGVQSVFASGLDDPRGLAFDNTGDLFVSDYGSGAIYKFTPDGAESVFASGLNAPFGLAIDGAGDLFEADNGSGAIYKFTPGGAPMRVVK